MKNFWLERAENREALQALETERTIEKILNNYVIYTTIGLLENFKCSNTLSPNVKIADIGFSYTLTMGTCGPCSTIVVDTGHSHLNVQTEKFQQELERVEAQGWVLDV